MKRLVTTVAGLLCLISGSPGCSTVQTMSQVDGGQTRRSGDSDERASSPRGTVEFRASASDLERAIPEAMADLQMTYIGTRRDGAVYQIDGKTLDRRTVSVTIRPGVGTARVSSRIGWFGDTLLSKALAERLGIRAGLLPPKPIPDQPPSSPDPNPIFSRSAVSDEEMYRDFADPYRDQVIP
jgi:hypothetical protein